MIELVINVLFGIYLDKKILYCMVNCTIKHLNPVNIYAVTMIIFRVSIKLELFLFDWLFSG